MALTSPFFGLRNSFHIPYAAAPLQIHRTRIRSQEETEEAEVKEEDFEARLARLQRKVTSGSGKKAELRKARKEGVDPSQVRKSTSKNVLLPPVPLKDPVSGGLVVELGFNPYTERLNGRFAALGLAAVILVELATGKSFLRYHEGAVLGIQIYAMLASAALFVKFEKERKSVWPQN